MAIPQAGKQFADRRISSTTRQEPQLERTFEGRFGRVELPIDIDVERVYAQSNSQVAPAKNSLDCGRCETAEVQCPAAAGCENRASAAPYRGGGSLQGQYAQDLARA